MLERVTIGIKTLLRDAKLFRSLADIRRTMPEAKIIVADDGEQNEEKDGVYADLIREGHKVIICPYDSGFGFKSNQIAAALDTEFLLISCDDFNHGEPDVRMGIEKMLEVLDWHPELDVVSGRVNSKRYEMYLIERQPDEWYERELEMENYLSFGSPIMCDLTVNYSLIRRKVFYKEGIVTDKNGSYWSEYRTMLGWDNDQKIGQGEHGAFFIDLKRSGHKVGYVPGVNINTQPGDDSFQYNTFRRRACAPERECFKRRGIKKYILANGQIDYEEKQNG